MSYLAIALLPLISFVCAADKYGTGQGQINADHVGQIFDTNAYLNAGIDLSQDPEYQSIRKELRGSQGNRAEVMSARDQLVSLVDKYFGTVSGFDLYTQINTGWSVPGLDIHTLTTGFSTEPILPPTTTLATVEQTGTTLGSPSGPSGASRTNSVSGLGSAEASQTSSVTGSTVISTLTTDQTETRTLVNTVRKENGAVAVVPAIWGLLIPALLI